MTVKVKRFHFFAGLAFVIALFFILFPTKSSIVLADQAAAFGTLTSCQLSNNPASFTTSCVDTPAPNIAQPTLYDGTSATKYDSSFGAKYFRITLPQGMTDQAVTQMYPDYSKAPAWNADGTRLLLYSNNGFWHLLDGNSYAYIEELGHNVWNYDGQDSEPRWSHTDPNIIYYVSGMNFYQYNIQTHTGTVVHNFISSELGGVTCTNIHNGDEGNPDDSDRYWAFECIDNNSNYAQQRVFIYDRTTDSVIAQKGFGAGGMCGAGACPTSTNWVGISHTGNYFLVNWNNDSNDGNLTVRGTGQEAFDLNLNYISKSSEKNWHGDVVQLADGTEVYVGTAHLSDTNGYNAVRAIRLSDGVVVTSCMIPPGINGYHISGRSKVKSWVLISTYDQNGLGLGSGMFASEIIAMNMDTCQVRRIAHDQSFRGADYFAEPHAIMNSDFTKVVWGSNWRVEGGLDQAYVAEWNTAVVSHTLTYNAGSHGSITGSSPQTVNYGADGAAVTAVADTGYHFVNWSDSSTSNPRTDTNITSDLTVTANFALNNTFTLTYLAGAHGTISGSTPQTVNLGASGTAVTVVPNNGYHFAGWSDSSNANPRTDANVSSNLTVTALYSVDVLIASATPGYLKGNYPTPIGLSADRNIFKSSTGMILAVYDDASNLYYKISADNGASWGGAVQFGHAGDTLSSSGAIDAANNVYIAYTYGSGAGSIIIKMQKINFSGGTWALGTVYTIASGSYKLSYFPCLTIDASGNLWAAYQHQDDTDSSKEDLYVRESTDGGMTWPTVVLVAQTTVSAHDLAFAMDIYNGQYPVIAYAIDGSPRYVHYRAWNGASWTADATLDANNNYGEYNYGFDYFSLTRVGNQLLYVGAKPGSYMNYSFFNGSGWSTLTNINSSSADTYEPQVASDGTNAWLFYTNKDVSGGYDVYYKKFNGSTWVANGTALTSNASSGVQNMYPHVPKSIASGSSIPYDYSVENSAPYNIYGNTLNLPHTLTYNHGANGTISGTTPQTVNYGADGAAVTAVAATGYRFVNWSDSSTQNPRTDTNVTSDITVTANFAINTYTLTYIPGNNGTISGTTPQTVNYGGSGAAVTAVADANYHFVNWSDLSTNNPRTDANVTADHTFTANFAFTTPSYTLTYSANANGHLTGITSQTVLSGANGTAVTAVANSGYHFVNWSDASTSNPRTDTNVLNNITVTANFDLTVVNSGGGGGGGPAIVYTPSITIRTPASGAVYSAGSSVGFDWTPVNGAFTKYKISYSTDNGTNWTAITNSATSTNFSWIVPNASTTQGKIKVEGYNSSGTLLASALSTGNFTITGTIPAVNPTPAIPTTPPPAIDTTSTGAYSPSAALANTPDINTDIGLTAPPADTMVYCTSGSLIKASLPAVYYCGADGKRYVFVNDHAFFSWYEDFFGVQTISDADLAKIPLGGNVTYRPGERLIKIQSDPKVYAVSRGGILRWVTTEAAAIRLYGANWNKLIDDIPDSFFVNYRVGAPIAE